MTYLGVTCFRSQLHAGSEREVTFLHLAISDLTEALEAIEEAIMLYRSDDDDKNDPEEKSVDSHRQTLAAVASSAPPSQSAGSSLSPGSPLLEF